jgi:hypothetical protein
MPSVDWFLKTTLGKILGILLTFGVGFVAAFFKGRGASWVLPLLYGLGGVLIVIGIIAGLACISYFSFASQKVRPLITSENIETKIREWAYAFGASVTKASESNASGVFFSMNIKPKNCPFDIAVSRPKAFPHYVTIGQSLTLSEEHKALHKKLNEQQVTQLTETLRIEMSRCRISHEIEHPLKRVYVEQRIPITSDLTEDIFIRRLDEVQHDIILARDTIVLGLESMSHEGQGTNG